MKLGIMQPYFLPYIGYFQLLNKVDCYVLYDDVNFIKGGWINRNRILINKNPKMLTLSLRDASPNKLINQIELQTNEIQRKKLLKTISQSYNKAPYFQIIFPLIEGIINFNEINLAKYIKNSLDVICEYLDINTTLIISSLVDKNNHLKGQDKVIDICKTLKATTYYNAIGGRDLYSFEDFKNEGISLKFLKTSDIKYKQFQDDFISNLSILDVLMFNSKDEIKKLLENYIVIDKD